MNAPAPSSGRAASSMRAAAIGLSAVAAGVALAGAAAATAALRHERVPFQLIQRFPLNPRPAPAAAPKPAAPAPVASPLKRDSGAGAGLPLAWLLLPVACACLVVGVWIARRRAAEPGEAAAAFRLGVLAEELGELDDAMAAYRRADQRGDAAAAFRLGVLLEERGELAGARAAYGRANQRGDGELATMARAALLNVSGGFQHAKVETAEPQTGGQLSTPQRAVRASRGRQRTAPGATKSRVLAALADGEARTAGEVASTIGLARGTVSTTLSRLAQRGEVLKAERGYRLPASSETNVPGTVASEPERPPS